MKIFGNGTVIIDDSNRYEFVAFNEPDEIDFFSSLDWILDYNQVKDLSEEETIALGQSIVDEKNNIAEGLNSMSPEEREKNRDMVTQYELLDFKKYSLVDFIAFKQGRMKWQLPEGVEYPTGIVQKKGLGKLIKTIFKKRKINQ